MSAITEGEKSSSSWLPQNWGLWRTSRQLFVFIVAVDAAAAVLAASGLAQASSYPHIVLTRFLLLIGLAVVFDEGSRRVERLRVRFAEGQHIDMTSVWTFAAAIVLPAGLAALLVAFVFGYTAYRNRTNASLKTHPYRQVYSAAAVSLSCLATSALLGLARTDTDTLPRTIAATAIALLALLTYTVVNIALIAIAVLLAIGWTDLRPLIGTIDDNVLEVATLCVGGLTALAVVHHPLMAVLALPPTFLLQRGALVKQLQIAASTDAKTGLLNAVAWQQIAQRDLARVSREHGSASVLLIDLDHFKAVNDTYGHLVGDSALIAVGRCITHELREYDTVGRFGGEEFVAMLPDVDPATVMQIAERVRHQIQELTMSAVTGQPAAATEHTMLSASIGVSCYPSNGADVEELLRAADVALYAAKRAGRNRTEMASPGSAGPMFVDAPIS
jgi:diguanylate cyclase (GGDEF)-like protein